MCVVEVGEKQLTTMFWGNSLRRQNVSIFLKFSIIARSAGLNCFAGGRQKARGGGVRLENITENESLPYILHAIGSTVELSGGTTPPILKANPRSKGNATQKAINGTSHTARIITFLVPFWKEQFILSFSFTLLFLSLTQKFSIQFSGQSHTRPRGHTSCRSCLRCEHPR